MTGVMPDPPAKSSRSAVQSLGVKIPEGGRTRSVSPGLSSELSQLEA